ncbi:ABC transporter substrate-binding protein [Porphyrobacter sp. TH134]|uniref:ABC transporter substrate-binding protein n=1 Tax=Porphyrobacter sp. TH134 TaxID=2067450 RepID=UPI0018F89A58|nr:ABC transporter substrate-binding protein [Porphyrobacter sp. TH134]
MTVKNGAAGNGMVEASTAMRTAAAMAALLSAACSAPPQSAGVADPEATAALMPAGALKPTLAPEDLVSFRRLPAYSEPVWVTRDFVAKGLLPPVSKRLPREPLVVGPAAMPDGTGHYGDALRQVTGGRPEGWNYSAGQSQGWGGVDIGTMECLTRTGPLFLVRPDALRPLPNLAKSWSWSKDGLQLTMNLVEGARWSDGHPFTSDDVMFYWTDNVLDPQVSPLGGAGPDTFGQGSKLEALGPYTIRWTFQRPFPEDVLYQMAYGKFCPGPAHVLRPQHPRYNKRNSYADYRNAFPAARVNFPVMGAWVVSEYRPDDILILRRNPYYWKVDAEGQQLPYFDELQYRLLGWNDRDIQVIAGTSDLANVEVPGNYVEVLEQAARPGAPFRIAFGPRGAAYSVLLNLSGNGWGEPDARAQRIRQLNRLPEFRQAISLAMDRRTLAAALAKGPFVLPYAGGILPETPFFDAAATRVFAHDAAQARRLLDRIGLKDTDGDGLRNFADGGNIEIVLTASPDTATDRTLAEGVLIFAREIGLRVILRFVGGTQRDAANASGQFDWLLTRANSTELITVVQGADALAPMGPYSHAFHRAGPDGQLDLLPYETEMVEIVRAFQATRDPALRRRLMARYQALSTENVNAVGLVRFPGALVVNRRIGGVFGGMPIFMFNWAEDAIMRERLFVPPAKQGGVELRPRTLPGCFDCKAR